MLSVYFNNKLIPQWLKINNIREDILPLESDKYKTKIEQKNITIDFSFKRNKLITEQKRRELINWIEGENFKPSKLVLPDRTEYYYMAKVSNISDVNGSIRKGIGSIVFTCYDTDYIEDRLNRATVTTATNIVYSGTTDVYPDFKITVNNSCSKIKLTFTNNRQSDFIELNGSFNARDVIEYNQTTNKITVNNKVNMAILHLKSKRSKLTNGSNKYSIESGNVTIEMSWNNRYL